MLFVEHYCMWNPSRLAQGLTKKVVKACMLGNVHDTAYSSQVGQVIH